MTSEKRHEPGRKKNCYFALPYRVDYVDEDVKQEGWDLKRYRARLWDFAESFYYANGDILNAKLPSLHQAFEEIETGRMANCAVWVGAADLILCKLAHPPRITFGVSGFCFRPTRFELPATPITPGGSIGFRTPQTSAPRLKFASGCVWANDSQAELGDSVDTTAPPRVYSRVSGNIELSAFCVTCGFFSADSFTPAPFSI